MISATIETITMFAFKIFLTIVFAYGFVSAQWTVCFQNSDCGIDGACDTVTNLCYFHYDDVLCAGWEIDGDYIRDTLEEATDACNQARDCGCFHHTRGSGNPYYLRKGTETTTPVSGREVYVRYTPTDEQTIGQ